MADTDLITGVEYVGCTRSSRLQSGTDHEFYRVSVRPSWAGFLIGTTSFSTEVQSLQGNLQAVSGDAVALADYADNAADIKQWGLFNGEPVTVDIMTLGNATKRTVQDMVAAIENAAQLAVLRVEAITADDAHSPDRASARDAASVEAKSALPINKLEKKTKDSLASLDTLVIAVILLAIVMGLGYLKPRR